MRTLTQWLKATIICLLAFGAAANNANAQTVTTIASGFTTPVAMTMDANGNIYVPNYQGAQVGKIHKVTPAGVVSVFANVGGNLASIGVDANNNVYTDKGSVGSIYKITPMGSISAFATIPNDYPTSNYVFDASGNLYAGVYPSNTIKKITPSGVVSTFASGFSYPRGLAWDASGNLYVCNMNSNIINKVTPSGVVSTYATSSLLYFASGITFDNLGNMYVANFFGQSISKVFSGGLVTQFVSGLPLGPRGIAYNAANNSLYYISQEDGNLNKIDLSNICTSARTFTVSACGSYTWAAKGNKVYTASNNTDTIILKNAAGCDSIVVLNLTINNGTFTSTTISSYNSYTWNANNQTYTTSGTYIRNYNNANGCASADTLKLTILNPPVNALNFDGSNDYVACGNSSNIQLASGTIEAWVYTTNAGSSYRTIVDKNYAYGLYLVDNVLCAYKYSTNQLVSTGVNLADGKWHHVAMAFNGNVANGTTIYVDGNAVLSFTYSAPYKQTNRFTIGASEDAASSLIYSYFTGRIDEVRVWNTVRSQSQIRANMYNVIAANQSGLVAYYNFDNGIAGGNNAGITSLPDLTGNNNTGTLGGFALTGSSSNWVESYAMVVPTATAATSTFGNRFTANWTEPVVGDIDNYFLDVSTNTNFSSFVAGYNGLSVIGTSKLVSGLTPNTTYYYRVRANKTSVANQGGYSNTTTINSSVLCTNTNGTFTVSACGSYTWAAKGNKVYTASNNTDTIVLVNAKGCDSIVTLNLTIISPPVISSITPSSVCAGSPVNLIADNSATQVQWQLNGNTVSTNNSLTEIPTTSGTTVAGGNGDGYAANQFDTPTDVALDALGNIYVVDNVNGRIQRWAPGATTGVTVAGGSFGSGLNQLNYPRGIYIDATGNLYVVDQGNSRVQRWAPGATTGVTVAGGSFGTGLNQLSQPEGVFVDASNNVYVADANNHRIVRWAPNATSGVVVAGGNGQGNGANQFNRPTDVWLDDLNNIYIADQFNHRIQRWAPNATSGVTVAGGNGSGSNANQLYAPTRIFMDTAKNIYIADQLNHRIQRWAPNATSGVTVAGGNGQGNAANQFSNAASVAVDPANNVYVADVNNNRIQRWAAPSKVTTYAPTQAGMLTAIVSNGICSDTSSVVVIKPASSSTFTVSACGSYTWVAKGNKVYTANNNTDTIVLVNANGCDSIVTLNLTIVSPPIINSITPSSACIGSPVNLSVDISTTQVQWQLNGNTVSTSNSLTEIPTTSGTTVAGGNGKGNAANQLNEPFDVALDALGNLYVVDYSNHRVQRWAPGATSGVTVAGGSFGFGSNQLIYPKGIYIDATGNLYVVDQGNSRVQRWAPGATTGVTVAGGSFGSGLNQLSQSEGVFVDASNNVYVADANNHRIVRWAPNATSGVVVAGGNGQGNGANQLNRPNDVWLDDLNNIYIADQLNHRIQKWAPNATTGVTVAGGNGSGSNANQLYAPTRIFMDTANNIYIADGLNHRIQRWAPNATSGVTVAGGNGKGNGANQFDNTRSVAVDAANNVYVVDLNNNRIQRWAAPSKAAIYTPTQAGMLTAIVSNGTCSDTSSVVVIKPNYTITATAGSNGSISNAGATSVCSGNSQSYTITPNSGFTIADVLVNGSSVGAVSSYTFTNVTANQTINVSFSSNSICTPTTGTFTISACGSYTWAAKGNKVYTASNNTDTIMLVNAAGCDSVVTLNLTIKPNYTITASSGANGSISNAGATTVCEGNNQAYSFTPNSGYSISGVVVNGTNLGAISSYTFTNVTANQTISVSFVALCSPTTSTTNLSICQSQIPYTWNGLTFNTAGTQTAHINNVGGCDSAATLNLTVNQATTSTSNISVCSSQLPYNWNGNRSTAGTYTFNTTNSKGCDSTATLVLTVSNSSAVSVSVAASANNVCAGTAVTFTATPTNGGTAPTYQWKKNGNNVGTNSATYTDAAIANKDSVWCVLTSNSACVSGGSTVSSNRVKMTIKPTPSNFIIYQANLLSCTIGATANVTTNTWNTMWSSSDTNVATVTYPASSGTNGGAVKSKANGSTTLICTVVGSNGCVNVQTAVFKVDAVTPAIISGASSACVGSTLALNTNRTGGVWTSSSAALAPVSTSGVVSCNSASTPTISYKLTNSSNCSATSIKGITINGKPAAPSLAYATGTVMGSIRSGANFCNNRSFTLVGTPSGGSWSSSNTAVATVNNAGLVNTVGLGTASIIYTVTNAAGCTNSSSGLGTVVACSPRGVSLTKDPMPNAFTIYPNPSTGVFNIKVNRFKAGDKIVITDILGKVVIEQNINSQLITLNSQLSKGMYFVSVVTEGGKETRKIIIND